MSNSHSCSYSSWLTNTFAFVLSGLFEKCPICVVELQSDAAKQNPCTHEGACSTVEKNVKQRAAISETSPECEGDVYF